MENRNALIVDAELATADGYAQRTTALEMLGRLPASRRRRTVAGDKGYDTKGFVAEARDLGVHPPRRAEHHPATFRDRRAHHPTRRSRSEHEDPQTDRGALRLGQTVGGGHKMRYIGRERNRAWFKITTATYNLIRITALDVQMA